MMKKIFLLLVCVPIYCQSFAQGKSTLTSQLTRKFSEAWNSNDISAMQSMLQPTAFFESPYQLRYGRDKMMATVLKTNPPVFKDVKTTEFYSHIEDNIAWSLGKLTYDVYDEKGKKTGKTLEVNYTYVFTRKDSTSWKIQMIILHEK